MAVKTAPAIRIQGLHKAYKQHQVLRNIDLDLPQQRLSVLIGRSGAGKSTLLRCLNGLETPDAGRLCVAGIELSYPDDAKDESKGQAVRQRTGMVFQQFHLFPHLTLLQNLELAPRVAHARLEAHALRRECGELLDKVGLAFHRDHYPSQMSGGQQQRAAIARALATKPKLLLFDEPTSALDPQLSEEVLKVMLTLKREGMTQVMVTHELGFARRYADWVVFLEDGVVVEQGPAAAVFGRPKDARTRAYVSSTPTLPRQNSGAGPSLPRRGRGWT
jgi:ABC-type polar amino acid transport system ATPase subunit